MTNTDINSKNEGKKVYEVGYLLLPNIDESKVSGEASNIRDIIEKNKGMFLSEGMPELKPLAYPMTKMISSKRQKFDNAYFGWIKFEADSEFMNSIKEGIDKMDKVLRHLIVVTTKENTIISSTPIKTGKFSFDEEKKTEDKEEKNKEVKEVEEDEEEITDDLSAQAGEPEKELDETIDELVIE